MQTLQIKVTDNALETVIFLLKNLKKGIISDISIINKKTDPLIANNRFDPRDYFNVMDEKKDDIDQYLINSRKEWSKNGDKK